MIKIGVGEYQNLVLTIKEKLEKMPEVVEACPVFGRYDMVARVKVKTLAELTRLVGDKIRSIDGVTNTETFVVHEG
ncbi:Lrp/AsnC ligand binding domain-containing protein [Candidatus Hadarchaeum sp.]